MADVTHRISRRAFLGMTAAGGAALSTGALPSLMRSAAASTASRPSADEQAWLEASIPRLQALMRSRRLTSQELTAGYLARIDQLNPLLHAVIETNPDALAIAARRDAERRSGRVRGPLHGIPVLGEGQHRDRRPHADDGGVARVSRQHGAGRRRGRRATACRRRRDPGQGQPLGVGELPRVRALQRLERARRVHPRSLRARSRPVRIELGFGGRGGRRTCAPSRWVPRPTARSCAPRATTCIVGLKPTIGAGRRDGIIPIAHSQDTAGPMTRTVTDAAILFDVLRRRHGDDDDARSRDDGDCTGGLRGVRSAARASASTAATSAPTSAASPRSSRWSRRR